VFTARFANHDPAQQPRAPSAKDFERQPGGEPMLIAVGNPRTGADAFGALGLAHLVGALGWRTWLAHLVGALGWRTWIGSLGLAAFHMAIWVLPHWACGVASLAHWVMAQGRRQPELGVLGSTFLPGRRAVTALRFGTLLVGALGLAHLGVAHSDVAILDAPLEPRGVGMSDRDWASGVWRTRLWHTGLRLTERRCCRVPLALSIEKLPRRG
jgi:hypothetical protein